MHSTSPGPTWRGSAGGRPTCASPRDHGSTPFPTVPCLDLAVANPPYVADGSPDVDAAVREWEPHGALFAGADGLDAIRLLVGAAPRWVRPGGWLVVEIGADQGDAVARLLTDAGYSDVDIRPDLAGRDRIAIGRVS